jgi:FkbM family methyltransferase
MTVVLYNRNTRTLVTSSRYDWVWAKLIQASHRLMAPLNYLGISRIHQLINTVFRPHTETCIIDGSERFCFPSNDYYWNRLLDCSFNYEPELDDCMKCFSNVPFTFVDLGANFGFWSSKVTAGRYGAHATVAVEASDYCFAILQKNAADGEHPVILYHRAIDEVTGRELMLHGDRHAGRSIDAEWYGAAGSVANKVTTITIDDALREAEVDVATTPTIIKLDVEGVELRALKGAHETIRGQSLFYIEDANKGEIADSTRYAADVMGMKFFEWADGKMKPITYQVEIAAHKLHQNKLQGAGYNFFATCSDFWIEQFLGANHAAAVAA